MEDSNNQNIQAVPVTEKIDLIYPYDYNASFPSDINPPFLDPNGPLYDSGLGLNVKVGNPIYIHQKSIGLKYSDTMQVNSEGKLNVKVDSSSCILGGNNGLKLNVDPNTFIINDGKLDLNIKKDEPIYKSSDGMFLKTDTSLTNYKPTNKNDHVLGVRVDSLSCINNRGANGLQIDVDTPLFIHDNKIKLQIGNSLQISNGKLDIKPGNGIEIKDDGLYCKSLVPLFVNENGVKLDYDMPLHVENNKLIIKFENPIYINNNSLGIKTYKPIIIDENGALRINLSKPLIDNGDAISIRMSPPLDVQEESLVIRLSDAFKISNHSLDIKHKQPLIVTENGFELNFSEIFNSNEGKLNINLESPLTVKFGKIDIKLGDGMTLDERGRLMVQTVYPLKTQHGGIGINIGNGLENKNNQLCVKTSSESCINFNQNGLNLSYDEQQFKVEDNKLKLLVNVESPTVFATYGDMSLEYFGPKGYVKGGGNGPISMYVTISWNGYSVIGNLRARINNKQIQDVKSEAPVIFSCFVDPQGKLPHGVAPQIKKIVPDNESSRNRLRPDSFYLTKANSITEYSFLDVNDLKFYKKKAFKAVNKQGRYTMNESHMYMSVVNNDVDNGFLVEHHEDMCRVKKNLQSDFSIITRMDGENTYMQKIIQDFPSINNTENIKFSFSNISNMGTVSVDNNCIYYDDRNVLRLKFKSKSLQSTNEGIELKVRDSFITENSDGIGMEFNHRDFINNNGSFETSIPMTYLSPYSIMYSGSRSLSKYTSIVFAFNNYTPYCSYYCYMVNSCGIVHGCMLIKIDKRKTNVGDAPSGLQNTNKFTFVLNINGTEAMNVSKNFGLGIKPDATFMTNFMIDRTFYSNDYIKDISSIENKFVGIDQVKFKGIDIFASGSTYNWKNTKMVFFPVKIGSNIGLAFTCESICRLDNQQQTQQNWYDSYAGSIVTGPFFFTYVAKSNV